MFEFRLLANANKIEKIEQAIPYEKIMIKMWQAETEIMSKSLIFFA